MVRFVLKRLAFAVVLVLVVTSASFVLVHVVPGDYFTRFGPGADLRAHAERAAAGFDRPLPVRYAEWLGRAMRLDLGTSLKFQQPVAPLVMRRAMNTALLGTCALVAATLLGLSLGVFTGSGDRVGHRLVGMASSATLAIPPLVWSLGTTALTARLGWLPPAGLRLSNLVVPAIALAFQPLRGSSAFTHARFAVPCTLRTSLPRAREASPLYAFSGCTRRARRWARR